MIKTISTKITALGAIGVLSTALTLTLISVHLLEKSKDTSTDTINNYVTNNTIASLGNDLSSQIQPMVDEMNHNS